MHSPISYRTHLVKTLMLSWPVILGQMGHVIISNADTIMIGQLSPTDLAASLLGNSLFFIPFSLAIGVCLGISPLAAQALGAKQERHTKLILEQSLLITFWLGLAITVLIYGSSYLIPQMGQDPDVTVLAQEYTRIIALSVLPAILFMTYKQFMEGFEVMLPGMVIMGIVVILNIGLNYWWIYGGWGFEPMGLAGAGWATTVSRFVGLLMIVGYMNASRRFGHFPVVARPWKFRKRVARQVIALGLPIGLAFFFEVGAFNGVAILAGWIGKNQQAAHGVAISLAALFFMLYSGFSAASSIRVGNFYGAKRYVEVRKAGVTGMALGMGFVLLGSGLLITFRHWIAETYVEDPGVGEIAAKLLLIAAFFQAADGLQVIASGCLRGISDVVMPTVISLLAYWGIAIPVGSWFAFGLLWDIEGLWYGLWFGLTISALFLILRFMLMTRKDRLARRRESGAFNTTMGLH